MHVRIIIGLLALAFSAMSGCGSGFQVTPVEGVVRLDGKPVAGVEVRFAPEADPKAHGSPFSRAVTDAEGRFALECDNKSPGAVVGKHTVMVRRPAIRPNPGEAPAPPPNPRIPPVYQSFGSTPLHVEVKPDTRVYDLMLKSTAK
jgi:hypothetical protein